MNGNTGLTETKTCGRLFDITVGSTVVAVNLYSKFIREVLLEVRQLLSRRPVGYKQKIKTRKQGNVWFTIQ